jgi:hypothetical protein
MEDTDLHPSAPVAEADEAANSVGVADEIELEPSASNTTDGSSVIVMPTTIEEQLSQLYQRQDEQMHLVSELRSRVLELEGFVQKLMHHGSSNSGNNCTTGAAVDRKRSNGEANPPPLPTTSTLSHHSDQASSSQLVDSSVAIANDNTITPASTTTTTTTSTDDEITTILHNRQIQKAWPLKRKYCSSFSQEIELVKVRFHNSTLYPHKTVRIPKLHTHQSQSSSSTTAAAAEEEALTSSSGLMEALTSSEETARSTTTAMETITTSTSHSQSDGRNDEAVTAACSSSSSSNNNNDNSGSFGNLGNKEGRLICRLCSGKTMNRNTSWMCNTCIVPLCIDIVDGDPQNSCFAKWHSCIDLVRENQILNGELREKRTMKKQRVSTGRGSGDGGGGREHNAGGERS